MLESLIRSSSSRHASRIERSENGKIASQTPMGNRTTGYLGGRHRRAAVS
ncbi:MAG: hypothetical protein F4Z50_04250 [Gemmatimonadetes bacterium]|nr:hypothetical protein [Gemmatimonadota bacterium]MYD15267.1 hypothetical protein [Gemmatimonadota bacterium]